MSPSGPLPDHVLRRWRTEVLRALPALPADVQEEVAQHAAERWREAVEAGLGSEAADARAWRELHGWSGHRLPDRDRASGVHARLAGVTSDARAAWRALKARPGSTVSAVALATVAIGANVLVAALVHGLLGRPLPYPDSHRLGVVWNVVRGEQGQMAYPDYADVRTAAVFDGAAAMSGGRGSVRVADGVERVNALTIEPDGLRLLGAVPAKGRLLTAEDAGKPVVLVSHRFWRRHLSSDPAAIGRTLWMSGTTFTVVGVLADGFDFELPVGTLELESHDVWMPFDSTASFVTRRDVTTYEVLVRLAPDATSSQAQAALDAVGTRLASAHPATNTGRTFRFVGLRDQVIQRARPAMQMLLVAGVATFVIAMANLIALTMVRLTTRRQELAVREALGAGALRLRAQLLIESAMIAGLGAAAGTGLAAIAVRRLATDEAANLPRPDSLLMDGVPLAVAAGLAILVAVSLTWLPARARVGLALLRGSGRVVDSGARLTRRVLIPIELGIALALSTGGALLTMSLVRLLSLDPGFAVQDVSTARVSAYAERYPDKAATIRFFEVVTERLAAMPAISATAASSSLPLSGQATGTAVSAFGRPAPPGNQVTAGWQFVTPGYFGAVGVRLVAGRDFRAEESGHDAHVTIVSESLARTLFADEDPIGKRVAYGSTTDWHEIIGVVADVRHVQLAAPPAPRAYDLFGQHWGRTMFVIARAPGGGAETIRTVQGVVRELDPETPVFEAAAMSTLVARSSASYALASRVSAGLSIGSVLIALLGVYGVVASNAASRIREFGVRIALGARPRDLHGRVIQEHAWMLAAGGLLGVACCVAVVRLLGALLFGVDARDAVVVGGALAAALAATSLGTALFATRRAVRVDPAVVLRE